MSSSAAPSDSFQLISIEKSVTDPSIELNGDRQSELSHDQRATQQKHNGEAVPQKSGLRKIVDKSNGDSLKWIYES